METEVLSLRVLGSANCILAVLAAARDFLVVHENRKRGLCSPGCLPFRNVRSCRPRNCQSCRRLHTGCRLLKCLRTRPCVKERAVSGLKLLHWIWTAIWRVTFASRAVKSATMIAQAGPMPSIGSSKETDTCFKETCATLRHEGADLGQISGPCHVKKRQRGRRERSHWIQLGVHLPFSPSSPQTA